MLNVGLNDNLDNDLDNDLEDDLDDDLDYDLDNNLNNDLNDDIDDGERWYLVVAWQWRFSSLSCYLSKAQWTLRYFARTSQR